MDDVRRRAERAARREEHAKLWNAIKFSVVGVVAAGTAVLAALAFIVRA